MVFQCTYPCASEDHNRTNLLQTSGQPLVGVSAMPCNVTKKHLNKSCHMHMTKTKMSQCHMYSHLTVETQCKPSSYVHSAKLDAKILLLRSVLDVHRKLTQGFVEFLHQNLNIDNSGYLPGLHSSIALS